MRVTRNYLTKWRSKTSQNTVLQIVVLKTYLVLSSSAKSAILIIITAKTFKMIFSREFFVKEAHLQ